jgi:hypothetical protein
MRRLSSSQVYCLAWAARNDPGDSRPPQEVFGRPRISQQTWRSLYRLELVKLDLFGTYVATELGVGWLMAQDLYRQAMRGLETE